MSLSTIRFSETVQKQVRFKLKSYSNLFTSLIMIQIIAILLFSFTGIGGMANGTLTIDFYSADIVIGFTMFWAFISSITITLKVNREEDLIFVSNRLSSGIANMIYLFIGSVIGGISAIMTSFLIQSVMYYIFNVKTMVQLQGAVPISAYVYGIIATILYLFLFSAMGYLIGTFVQANKIFILVLPTLLVGLIIVLSLQEKYIINIFGEFYFQEHSFLLLFLKIFGTVSVLFLLAISISNRQEVRK